MRDEAFEVIATRIVERGLAVPAVFFLEMHKPLAGLVHGTLTAFDPLVGAALGRDRKEALLKATESRESIEKLISLIEAKCRERERGNTGPG